jgi:2-polyprenyl-3-methyl-5-hydroxy-6-metoxy-1,4-benzoquinol methylase
MNNINLSYFRHERKPLSVHIPQGNFRILDVGCGAGYFGAYLKKSGKASKVYGIELYKDAADEAAKHLDRVLCADLDSLDLSTLRNEWGDHPFDVIVCADVLEHVKNPWKLLTDLAELLAPGGKVVVSLPNVRHWSVLFPLLFKGQWNYQEAGIMDRTHLRFFSKSTASELIQRANLCLASTSPLMGPRAQTLSKISCYLLEEFLAEQYVFVAVRNK